MRLKRLSNKEIRELNKDDSLMRLNISFNKGDELYIVSDKAYPEMILKDKRVILFKYDNAWVPSLHLIVNNRDAYESLPKVAVNDGAVAFVLNGANIMRPGIVDWTTFSKDNIVLVLNKNKGILAVGTAVISSENMKDLSRGVAVKNIHYVNDKIFKFTR